MELDPLDALVRDLEELARRMREDPLFPWRKGDDALVGRINEGSRAVGIADPVGFDFDRERGIARFAVRSPDQKPESLSLWVVPRRSTLPRGDLCFDFHAAPLGARIEYAAIVARWPHHLRSTLREPVPRGPRFPEVNHAVSPKVMALYEVLRDSYPQGLIGKEIVKRMGEKKITTDEQEISNVLKKQLIEAGCDVVNQRGVGYSLVPLRQRTPIAG